MATAHNEVEVAFAEIAIEMFGFTETGPHGDTYGLGEPALEQGGERMVAAVERHYVTKAEHDRRVTELILAVNREVENRRALAAMLRKVRPLIAVHRAEEIQREIDAALIGVKR